MNTASTAVLLCLTWCLWFRSSAATENCRMEDWSVKFSKKGFSNCESDDGYYYIKGFQRSDDDSLLGLKQAKCCRRDQTFWNLPTQCQMPNWVNSMGSNGWSFCQDGFFLRGLYRGIIPNIGNIEWGKCCKPSHHPYHYGDCYYEDASNTFNRAGFSECKREGHFIAGFKTTAGNQKLSNIVQFKCCKMATEIPQLTSIRQLKERVMDTTMTYLGHLAHNLGYAWAGGCWADYIGEDFKRAGDTWEAAFRDPCPGDGPKKDVRLKIHFGNFSFGMKDVIFGESKMQTFSLEEEKLLESFEAKAINDRDVSYFDEPELEIRLARTLKNVKTTSWDSKFGIEVGFEYEPPSTTGGVGFSAKTNFKYEWGGDEEESTADEDWHIFKIKGKKELPKHSFSEWRAIRIPRKVTLPYTAKILPKFSVILEGYMRWGGGPNGGSTNFHAKYRGSGDRPNVKHNFGDAQKPFYEALKEQSEENMHPWQWHAMRQRYSESQELIDILTDEDLYIFTMSGQFEETTENEVKSTWSSSRPIDQLQGDVARNVTAPTERRKTPEFPRIKPPPPKIKPVDNSKEMKPPPPHHEGS